ncbi:MAG: DMT family transporter [Rubritepida sp.]|nr:DMT family transporter [Rubritepida sp.]
MTPRAVGLFLLLLTALGWGSNWPLLKRLLDELPPFAARGYAGLLAAALLAAIALARGVSLRVPPEQWGRLSVFAFLNVTAWMGFSTVALVALRASEGAIVAFTMPVWAALLAWLLLGEKLGAARLLALALGVGGVLLLFGPEGLAIPADRLWGVGLLLAAALLFAYGAVVAKRAPLPLPPLAAVAWQMLLGCAPLALLSLLIEAPDWGALSAFGWGAFLWMAAVPLAMAYMTWFGALARLPASTAALGTLITPIVGVLGAAIALGEPFGWRQGLALACILAGVALAAREPGGAR